MSLWDVHVCTVLVCTWCGWKLELTLLQSNAHNRCDGVVIIHVERNRIRITDMENGSAAMDYAAQNKAMVKFSVDGYDYEGDKMIRNAEKDYLLMEIKQTRFFRQFSQGNQLRVFVHFEISHWYFWRLHCAISCASDHLIEQLVEPQPKSSKSKSAASLTRGNYSLDKEYQLQALTKMLSCRPGAPYLLLGPFGTGKTYVLAATVERLVSDSHNRILVCTHQNTAADKLYRSLQEKLEAVRTARLALRVVPDDQGSFHNKEFLQPYSCEAVRNLNIHRLSKWPVIVTTFLTALTIKDKHCKEGGTLHFSHIIMDEGAQSREPEALAALVLADSDTRIIIAGDHQQVCCLGSET